MIDTQKKAHNFRDSSGVWGNWGKYHPQPFDLKSGQGQIPQTTSVVFSHHSCGLFFTMIMSAGSISLKIEAFITQLVIDVLLKNCTEHEIEQLDSATSKVACANFWSSTDILQGSPPDFRGVQFWPWIEWSVMSDLLKEGRKAPFNVLVDTASARVTDSRLRKTQGCQDSWICRKKYQI